MRGGKREGAGRPAPDGERIHINVRVSPAAEKKLRRLADSEGSLGKAIDKLAEHYNI